MRKYERWVYVAADERGWHKIGCTGNARLRAYHLQRDLGFKPVKVIHSVKLDGAAPAVENTAHWLLIDADNHREWFNVSRERAISAVAEAEHMVAIGEGQVARFSVERRLTVRDQLNARIIAALRPGESRQRLMELAVEAELQRREKG